MLRTIINASQGRKRFSNTNQLTLTNKVLGASIEGASTPLRYALTSGMPDPAAAGATKAQRAAAAMAKSMLQPA